MNVDGCLWCWGDADGRWCSGACASAHMAYEERCTDDDDQNFELEQELNAEFGIFPRGPELS